MNEVPEKGRDTTRQGRADGPNGRNGWQARSVPGPSTAERKGVTDAPVRPAQALYGWIVGSTVSFALRQRFGRRTAEAYLRLPPDGSGVILWLRPKKWERPDRQPPEATEAENVSGGAVPSAGWRTVASALEAMEGMSHE